MIFFVPAIARGPLHAMAEQPAPRRSKREGKKKNNEDEIDPEEIDTSPLKVGTKVECNYKGRKCNIHNG